MNPPVIIKQSKKPTLVKPLTDLKYDHKEYDFVENQTSKHMSETNNEANQIQAKHGTIEMTRLLIGDQIIRWQCAQDASQEKSPGSAANCWVDGYLHGLQYANSVLPEK